MEKVYKLKVVLEIQEWEKDEDGIHRWSNGGFRMDSTIDLGSMSFLQMAQTMAAMHLMIQDINVQDINVQKAEQ